MKARIVIQCPSCGIHRVLYVDRQCALCEQLDKPRPKHPIRNAVVVALLAGAAIVALLVVLK